VCCGKRKAAAKIWWAARVKMRWKRHTEINNEKTKLARQFNPNTYWMKVLGKNDLLGQGKIFCMFFVDYGD
jgi:hypothetical protein